MRRALPVAATALLLLALSPPGAAESPSPAPPAEPCGPGAESAETALLDTFRELDAARVPGQEAGEPELERLLLAAARAAPDLLGPEERVLLARRAETRGDPRDAILQWGHVLAALQRRGVTPPGWIGERIRQLDAGVEARRLRIEAYTTPGPRAREAFARGRDAAAAGRLDEARRAFEEALSASPGYVDAALSLAVAQSRAGRPLEAEAAYRRALAADPDRVEALSSLSDLLWEAPDRGAKAEALSLLDRAAALRPGQPRLLLRAAERWAGWGDAHEALSRLDAYRARATPSERSATDSLRERLETAAGRGAAGEELPPSPDLSRPAEESYRLARVWAQKGEEAATRQALQLLSDVERLDPGFAPAAELAAALHARLGEEAAAEAALRRATNADPSRAQAWEALAELVDRRGGRDEAEALWRRAEAAGSREALLVLGRRLLDRGSGAAGAHLLRRYLEEAPGGPGAPEARDRLAVWESRRRRLLSGGLALLGLVLVAAAGAVARRLSGTTLEAWLSEDPAAARELRPLVGRLRHEAFKHGRLLLGDARSALETAPPAGRRAAARHLLDRLFGPEGGRGLVDEAAAALAGIGATARARGRRLNLSGKDPLLTPVARALGALRRCRRPLERVARASGRSAGPPPARLLSLLASAEAALDPSRSRALGRLLERASATDVGFEPLERLLDATARDAGREARLVPLGAFATGDPLPRARILPADLATLFRNLFSNALAAGSTTPGAPLVLGLSGEAARDPVTAEPLLRLRLADPLESPLTADMIRGRAADRGLGVVADIVRAAEGFVDVVGPPEGTTGFRKAVLVELPALEREEEAR